MNIAGAIQYRLVGLTGKLLASGQLDQASNRVMTNTLRSGIYLLAMETGDGERLTRKIYVN